MVSNDTKVQTFRLLKDNKCFGLRRRQIFIVEQGSGVPALGDNDAKIVMEDGKIVTKPHGHGDIHSLLYKGGITKKWEEEFGTKYMVLFQVREFVQYKSNVHFLLPGTNFSLHTLTYLYLSRIPMD